MLPTTNELEKVLDTVGCRLVLLGAAGSGKTTALAKIHDVLLAKAAEQGSSAPVPVYLTLASWTDRTPRLEEWLAEQIGSSGFTSAEAHLILAFVAPVLDGLDEVPHLLRAGCARSIASYTERHSNAAVVVSCRSDEFQQLPEESVGSLEQAALVPLSGESVAGFFERFDQRWTPLVGELRTPASPLAAALATPLMLSVAVDAFRRVDPVGVEWSVGSTPDEIRTELGNRWVQRATVASDERTAAVVAALARAADASDMSELNFDALGTRAGRVGWSAGKGSLVGVLAGLLGAPGLVLWQIAGRFGASIDAARDHLPRRGRVAESLILIACLLVGWGSWLIPALPSGAFSTAVAGAGLGVIAGWAGIPVLPPAPIRSRIQPLRRGSASAVAGLLAAAAAVFALRSWEPHLRPAFLVLVAVVAGGAGGVDFATYHLAGRAWYRLRRAASPFARTSNAQSRRASCGAPGRRGGCSTWSFRATSPGAAPPPAFAFHFDNVGTEHLYALGIHLASLGEHERGLRVWDRALRLAPRDPACSTTAATPCSSWSGSMRRWPAMTGRSLYAATSRAPSTTAATPCSS